MVPTYARREGQVIPLLLGGHSGTLAQPSDLTPDLLLLLVSLSCPQCCRLRCAPSPVTGDWCRGIRHRSEARPPVRAFFGDRKLKAARAKPRRDFADHFVGHAQRLRLAQGSFRNTGLKRPSIPKARGLGDRSPAHRRSQVASGDRAWSRVGDPMPLLHRLLLRPSRVPRGKQSTPSGDMHTERPPSGRVHVRCRLYESRDLPL
jgi:hypothetical protein